jgi:hypothetical protein
MPRSKNEWSYTSTPPNTLMAWCSVKVSIKEAKDHDLGPLDFSHSELILIILQTINKIIWTENQFSIRPLFTQDNSGIMVMLRAGFKHTIIVFEQKITLTARPTVMRSLI